MAEFIGQQNIKHVAMPEGSDLCFAACAAAVVSSTVQEAQRGLLLGNISRENGETPPPLSPQAARIGDTMLFVDPVESPVEGSGETTAVIERIYQELRVRRPVALLALHKKGGGADFPHWTLLAGYLEDQGEVSRVAVMDPKKREMAYESPASLERLIDHSLPLPGAYAYTLATLPVLQEWRR